MICAQSTNIRGSGSIGGSGFDSVSIVAIEIRPVIIIKPIKPTHIVANLPIQKLFQVFSLKFLARNFCIS